MSNRFKNGIRVSGTRDRPKVEVRWYENGRQRWALLDGLRTRKEGEEALRRIRVTATDERTGLAPRKGVLAGPLIEQWLASISNREAKADRGRVRRHVLPKFKNTPMSALHKPKTVVEWLEELKQGPLSPASQRHMLNYLSRFLGWCVEKEYASRNVVHDIPKGKRPGGSVATCS